MKTIVSHAIWEEGEHLTPLPNEEASYNGFLGDVDKIETWFYCSGYSHQG